VTRAAVEGLPEGTLDTLVKVRLARQDVLRSNGLRLEVVLDEAVLRRSVGGPQVMADQLARLLETARLGQVRLQVLPFSAGAHIGVTGPFVILSFPNIIDLDVVVLDHMTSTLYLEGKEELQAYNKAFTSLQFHSLSTEDSLDFIAGLL